jgi:tRNA nucleotidyltransferase (CCA-adding enzyme)
MKSQFRIKLPLSREVQEIIRTLRYHGLTGYVVGGAVRDLLLGATVSDWDLATDGTTDRLVRLFPKVVPTGIRHGTVTVIHGTSEYEITTFRTDGDYASQHALRQSAVTPNIEEDLRHRDFTINAMAYDPLTKILIDPFGGRKDLRNRILRGVENPVSRFHEDGLRVYRAIRFSVTLECRIEDKTWKAIPLSLDRAREAAWERIRDEILKILGAQHPSQAFEMMRKTGLLMIALPELLDGYEMRSSRSGDIYHHLLGTADAAPRRPLLRLACLLHDLGRPKALDSRRPGPSLGGHEKISARMAATVAKRLKLSNHQTRYVCHLIEHHGVALDRRWSAPDLRRFLSRIDRNLLDDLFLLCRADRSASGATLAEMRRLGRLRQRSRQIIASNTPLAISELAISGETVKKILGAREGVRIGRILNRLLDVVLEDPTKNTPQDLALIVRKMSRP